MGNTEKIMVEDREFTVFRRPPIPIARKIQKLLIELSDGFQGDFKDLEGGEVKLSELKGINMDLLYEAHDILLTEMVINPNISKVDIDNIEHELQPYLC